MSLPIYIMGKRTPEDREAWGIEPLLCRWNGLEKEFSWSREGEGLLTATLPFGILSYEIQPDEEPGVFRADCRLTVQQDVEINCLELRYRDELGAEGCRTWVPHLRPGRDMVIADQVFRSPVIIRERGPSALFLVPDLGCWDFQELKSYLDFHYPEQGIPRLAYGLGNWKESGHIFFKRVDRAVLLAEGAELRFSHFIVRSHGKAGLADVRAASFIWERFRCSDRMLPQLLDFARYEQEACARIFSPDLYKEITWEGRKVAGMITQTVTSRKKPGVMNLKATRSYLRNQDRLMGLMGWVQKHVFTSPTGYKLLTRAIHSGRMSIIPMTSFACWFNQARTSLGAGLHAGSQGNGALLDKALKILDLALASPREEGCPSSICFFPEGETFWMRGTRSFGAIDSFHLPDAATTGFHLLEWMDLVPERREEILKRAVELGDFLLARQAEDGSFPSWVAPADQGFKPSEILEHEAASAGPAMFLGRLFRVAGGERFRIGTDKALIFIEKNVVDKDRWFDYELLYSCAGRPTGQDGPDPYTLCYPENTLSMYWAAQAWVDLLLATGDDRYLEPGLRCLGRLSLYQQAFDHPRCSMDTFGGFGVMNADGEFNDARQGLFVPTYLDWYEATGEPEYFHRAIAALRSCYATMLLEEHRKLHPGNMRNFRESDRGSVLENYGHTGRDEMTAGYLSPDWGCGTSLYASGMVRRRFGQIYVDLSRGNAFGIDRCVARFLARDEVAVSIEVRSDGPLRELEVAAPGLAEAGLKLLVNGKAAELDSHRPGRYLITC